MIVYPPNPHWVRMREILDGVRNKHQELAYQCRRSAEGSIQRETALDKLHEQAKEFWETVRREFHGTPPPHSAIYQYQDFSGVNLHRLDFDNVNFSGSSFRGAWLYGTNFSHAHMIGCDFGDAHAIKAVFIAAQLACANMMHTDLTDTNLRGADVRGTLLCTGTLPYPIMVAGPVGSRADYVSYKVGIDEVKTGCFQGTLDEFERAVLRKHRSSLGRENYSTSRGPSPLDPTDGLNQYGREYVALIDSWRISYHQWLRVKPLKPGSQRELTPAQKAAATKARKRAEVNGAVEVAR